LIKNIDLIKNITDLISRKDFISAKNKLLSFSEEEKDCYYFNMLGYVNQELKDFEEAEKNYIKSLDLNKNFLEARFNQACLLVKKKLFLKAEEIFLELIKENAEDYLSQYNLGIINFEQEKYNIALEFFKKASDIQPNFYYAYHQLGLTYEKLKNLDEAIKSYNIANMFNADKLNISYNNLGVIFLKSKKLKEALKYFQEALKFNGEMSLTYQNIAIIFSELGDTTISKNYMQKAVVAKKSDLKIFSRYLGTFPYSYYDFKDYEFWATEFRKNIKNLNHNCNKIDFSKKKLRLAFFSADFRNHPVGYFLLDLLPKLKLSNFDIYAYFNNPYEDNLSEEIKKNLIKWEKVSQLSTQEILDLIKLDKIDLLIDMSGHTNNNNLEIFANKAAPIQLSWAAFLASTGIKEIDYIIGDQNVTPLSTKEYFSEKILNLKNIWCCLSTSNIPAIDTVDTPAIKNNYITYGSFNNLNKITNEVIIVWSNILKNSPNSKLFIKNYQLDNIYTKDILFKKFEKHGINKEKLILESSSSREDILKKYNSIDIALDTFPWNGGTTSFEVSWMCVPLLTLSGDRFMSRCGESINKNLNMNDWIAHNTDDYILQATKYCNNFDLLNKIRLNLRNSSRKSVLFDTDAFSISFLDCLNKVVDIYKKQNN
jgi:predicted O-linked N-acetylglucosamine transferase (SPINDLY family)